MRLPDAVDGQPRRWTDAQATGAWGDPASVILTCGVDAARADDAALPDASNGVDWVIDESDAPRYRVTTFGRTPAVEVYLDNDVVSSAEVLDALSQIVERAARRTARRAPSRHRRLTPAGTPRAPARCR